MKSSDPRLSVRDDSKANLSVAFLLLPDFTLSTFATFVDALRIAADEADRSRQLHCRWTILGADRTPVRSSCGVEIVPWGLIGDPAEFDYTIVVGGLLRGHARIDKRITSYLRQVDERGGSLVGVCTGSFALARAGLMKNHRCCVHWHHLKEFTEEFPGHRAEADVVYLVDGRRITCAGGQSAIDVAVHLVERHCGRRVALKVISGMVVAAARGPKHPQPHPESKWFREIKSSLVQRAILLMEQQPLGQHAVMQDVAAQLGVSGRTLVRGFQATFKASPTAFFRALRMSHGRWELINTEKSIGGIAVDHGFSDASHFTRLFRRYYGVTPAMAREMPVEKLLPARRKPSRPHRTRTALEEILWGESLTFAALDWPSEQGRQTALLADRTSAGPAQRRRPNT
jgi:transcriptional regulator GlxA family with amidase domain